MLLVAALFMSGCYESRQAAEQDWRRSADCKCNPCKCEKCTCTVEQPAKS